jgi:hypothetical protein
MGLLPVAQMRPREFPVYDFVSRQARDVLNGAELAPQAATALAMTHLVEWLTGERKVRQFPKPPRAEMVTVSNE